MNELLFVTDVSPYRFPGQGEMIAGVHQSLGSAAIVLAEIAALSGLSFRHASQVSDVTVDDLRVARVLALYTIGETPWTLAQREVVEARAASGALGIVGLHSASDAAYEWPAIGELLGGRFGGHPITGDLLDSEHPATAHLPSPWRFHDELYLFQEMAPDVHVLLAVELNGAEAVSLPLAWCVERPPMRSFYTALGHFVAAYEDANYLQHVQGGIEWVLGQGRAAPISPPDPA